jgi:hypothetical protein
MKKLLYVLPLVFLATACATKSDITKLQGEINELGSQHKELSDEIANTRKELSVIDIKAEAAKVAAERAEAMCKETNTKLNNLFKKAQFK